MQATTNEETSAGQLDWRLGVVLAIAGTFLFALKSIFIKLAFEAGANATELLTLRMAFSLPFYFAVWLRINRLNQPTNYSIKIKAVLLGFLGYYLASYLDLQGLNYISAQLERLTLFTYPAIVAVLAWAFLGEQLNKRIISSIVLSYLGVALMYWRESGFQGGDHQALGVALVIGAAVSYSLYVLFAKPTMQVIGSRHFTSLAMMGSSLFVGVHFLVTQNAREILQLSPSVYAYAIVLAIGCTVIPSFMINEAIMRIGATRTTVIGSVGPVLTLLLAVLILREPTSVLHWLGMLLALIGVSLVSRKGDS
ncbi:MAG: DMT family transporter [Aureliella sp.]